MQIVRLFAFLLAALVSTSPLGFAAEKAAAPEALVSALYKAHDRDDTSIFHQTKSRAPLDRYFSKPLADLIWKDAVEADGEVGSIDGDPLYDAQDMEIKKLTVHPATTEGDKVSVEVTFENFGEKQKLVFSLVSKGSEWRISDIRYTDGRSLLGTLKEAMKQ